jgi:AraC-like DNA-binding protein
LTLRDERLRKTVVRQSSRRNMIRIETIRPSAPLADSVEAHTLYTGSGSLDQLQRVFPTSATELTINLSNGEVRCYDPANLQQGRASGPLLTGLFSRYYIIDTAQLSDMISVRLRPGGVWRLFGVPASELANRHITLRDLLGRRWDDLADQLVETRDPAQRVRRIESSLVSPARRRELHPAVKYALDKLRRTDVRHRAMVLARESGLSFRRFNELFVREVGLTVKAFVRLLRFERVVAHARANPTLSWSQAAADFGFSDQAHLIREFSAFAGYTPTQFLQTLPVRTGHPPRSEEREFPSGPL